LTISSWKGEWERWSVVRAAAMGTSSNKQAGRGEGAKELSKERDDIGEERIKGSGGGGDRRVADRSLEAWAI
jgi:hypothetical protein